MDPAPAPYGPAPRPSDPALRPRPVLRKPHVTPGRGPALLRPRGGCPAWVPRGSQSPGLAPRGAAVCACAPRGTVGPAPTGRALPVRRSGRPVQRVRPVPALRPGVCPPAGLAPRPWFVPVRWARSQAAGQSRGPWFCKYRRPRVFCVGGGARAGGRGPRSRGLDPEGQASVLPPARARARRGRRRGARAAARGEDGGSARWQDGRVEGGAARRPAPLRTGRFAGAAGVQSCLHPRRARTRARPPESGARPRPKPSFG